MENRRYISRSIELDVISAVQCYPVVAVTGPRQCGKSTLVRHLFGDDPQAIHLDLERPSDLAKLKDPELFFMSQKDKLICLDEIQRHPDLFPLIRSLVDEWDRPGCFVILGSASRDLLQQSSESLAGRILYKRLTPFLMSEVKGLASYDEYLFRGGFPRSTLAESDLLSFDWRESFISTFVERDLAQWAGFTPQTMSRLWSMLAHVNGQTLNCSALASSLGITAKTVRNYIDLLASTFMVEVIPPDLSNHKKRLVKAPKVYIADSGILMALLQVKSVEQMFGHPAIGGLWEQVVLSTIRAAAPRADITFYRTSNGAEVDFVVRVGVDVFAIECKVSSAPVLSKGNHNAIADIGASHTFVVTPLSDVRPYGENIDVVSLDHLSQRLVALAG